MNPEPGKRGIIREFAKKQIRENSYERNLQVKFVNFFAVDGARIVLFLKYNCKKYIFFQKLS